MRKKLRVDKQEVMNQIVIAVRAYGRKAMANDLNKAYSTLSNELEERDWGKLGLRDAMTILELCLDPSAPEQSRVAAYKALDMIDAGFNRIAYNIPPTNHSTTKTLRLVSKFMKESSENFGALADAMDDNEWQKHEVERCLKENRDVMQACLEIEYHLNHVKDAYFPEAEDADQ